MNKTSITVLRWVAVLPAAVAGAIAWILVDYLTSDLVGFFGTKAIEFNPISSFFGSLFFVFAGTFTAPSGRKAVSIVLATIKAILPILIITLTAITSTIDGIKWYEWLNTLSAVAGAIAASIYICRAE